MDNESGSARADEAWVEAANVAARRKRRRFRTYALVAVVAGLQLALLQRLAADAGAPVAPLQQPMGSLKNVAVPGPSELELAEFLQDKKAAVQLGKALFWDSRVGSDNRTACASCHFQAGADNRIANQINPGLLSGDHTFQTGGPGAGPNLKLGGSDFPFTRHAVLDDSTTIVADNNDVVSSQGVFTATLDEMNKKGQADDCTDVSDAVFHGGSGFVVGGVNTRRVEPRNTPTVINSVFNFRNFWDGRGNNVFNGGDPFGLRNPELLVWKLENGILRNVAMALPSSSLASQASGPPLSGNEMSCRGRAFVDIAQKLLGENLLALQTISPGDSVLGAYARKPPTYAELVKKAFRPEYWGAPTLVDMPGAYVEKFK